MEMKYDLPKRIYIWNTFHATGLYIIIQFFCDEYQNPQYVVNRRTHTNTHLHTAVNAVQKWTFWNYANKD